MPAKMSPLEVTVSALTLFDVVRPLSIGIQLRPLFVERNTPPPKSAPAKTSPLALMVSERMYGTVIPLLTSVQFSPLSLERKTPLPHVPAKICPLALIASAGTYVFVRPLFTSVQFSPLSVER